MYLLGVYKIYFSKEEHYIVLKFFLVFLQLSKRRTTRRFLRTVGRLFWLLRNHGFSLFWQRIFELRTFFWTYFYLYLKHFSSFKKIHLIFSPKFGCWIWLQPKYYTFLIVYLAFWRAINSMSPRDFENFLNFKI